MKMTKARRARIDRTKALKVWAVKVKELDGNKCAVCGNTKYLNSHHILPKEYYHELQYNVANGITLDASCHKYHKYSFHKNPAWAMKWLEQNRTAQYNFVMDNV